ncbi:g7480 [Coccomyxa viridis]|uniref:serine--tRNA ligase n=1 Tax=Coccomyxa viridis TaxID=1274662 RepID=A0ABP1G4L3_9CHLO
MLDINLFREGKGGNPELIRESQRRRYADPAVVDKVIALDNAWRDAVYAMEGLKRDANTLNKEIGTLRKAKKDATELQEKSKSMKAEIVRAEEAAKEAEAVRDKALMGIGNLVHDSVPVDNDEAHNVVVKTEGDHREGTELYNHVDLVQLLGIVDMESGSTVAGGRGFYLINEGVLLNQALIQAALHHGYAQGCSPVMTPFFMRKDIMAECAQLEQFDEELYKVTGEGDDKYLIATSEQPLCAMHRQQWFGEADLPLKYVGYSTCFRKEAGSHGRDTLGIFRIHQFEKVEQFFVTSPDNNKSWEAMEEMLHNAEEFYTSLGLAYRVVNMVSGELNNAAAKKYDLEAWFPASRAYRELVSCSNCTDYQSRRLEVRLRTQKLPGTDAARKEYVHMLNCTLSATERTLCCILENYQTPDGVRIPEVLQKFMPNNMTEIKFRKKKDAKGRFVAI